MKMNTTPYRIDVPKKFCFPDKLLYPPGNEPDQEYYIYQTYHGEEGISRIYLPIMFTAYLKFHNYGNNNRAIKELQDYVNTLDKSLKYWAVCQYDDGTLIDWTGIDIIIFASGCKGTYQISLSCQPHTFDFSNVKRDILCSFVGRITHPIRKEIMKLNGVEGFYISEQHHTPYHYHNIMARSHFVIASRGYGASCFKIFEAIQNGAIPIYVSDEFLIPHDEPFKEYGMLMNVNNIDKGIPFYVKNMPPSEKNKKIKMLSNIYEKIYSFEGNKKYIIQTLLNEVE